MLHSIQTDCILFIHVIVDYFSVDAKRLLDIVPMICLDILRGNLEFHVSQVISGFCRRVFVVGL